MTAEDHTAALLARARETLKSEILPHLPPERRYPALMTLTALGIAARRHADGAVWRAEALRRLLPFALGAHDLAAALRMVAGLLRADPAAADPALHAALLALARAAAFESNPKARALRGLPDESDGSPG